MKTVEIDKQSGFCGGVIMAISNAQKFLASREKGHLYSLGDIVHNEAELARLSDLGLVTIDKDDLEQMPAAAGETLLIRAHGEPPQTYDKAGKLGFEIIDCTCPVVLKIQQSIREVYEKQHADTQSGQIVIFGKIGHAEVLGLVGQVNGDAVVVESLSQLKNLVDNGEILLDKPIDIFSQTTMSPVEYTEICNWLFENMNEGGLLNIHDTICRQVAFRHKELAEFSVAHDVVIFVSGKSSSNGKVLSNLCKSYNIRTYHISDVGEIHREWFRDDDSVGVCGATSTPKWLLEKVAQYIENLQ